MNPGMTRDRDHGSRPALTMSIHAAPRSAQAARTQQAVPDRLFPERRPAFAAPNSLICASKRKSSPTLIADHNGGYRVSSLRRLMTERDLTGYLCPLYYGSCSS